MSGLHLKKHSIVSTDDHSPGNTPNAGEYNVPATNDAGNITEVRVEAPNLTTYVLNRIVVRSANGQVRVPAAPENNLDAVSKQYLETVVLAGPYKAAVHSVVANHTAATVGDGGTGGAALTVGSHVINTTDGKYYTVTAGTGNGSQVTWDAGILFTTVALAPDDLQDLLWQFDPQTGTWTSKGALSHAQLHTMTSVTSHSATPWRMFFSNAAGNVAELALAGAGKVLLSGGTTVNPLFSTVGWNPTVVTGASELLVSTDAAALTEVTAFFGIGSTGRHFFCVKSAGTIYGCELSAVAV